jgi:hypothetical protein
MKSNHSTPRVPRTPLTGIKQVLLKFYFTNEGHVPAGIRFEKRDQEAVDAGHIARAKTSKEGAVAGIRGRKRFGQIDNGNHWADNVPNVCGALCIQPMLSIAGYKLADIHYYYQAPRPKPGDAPVFGKWVVVITCDLEAEKSILQNPANLDDGPEREAAALLGEQIKKLMSSVWGYLHGWNNADGGAPTITLNFNHYLGKRDGENAVIVEGEKMKVVPLQEALDAFAALRARLESEAEAETEEEEALATA